VAAGLLAVGDDQRVRESLQLALHLEPGVELDRSEPGEVPTTRLRTGFIVSG